MSKSEQIRIALNDVSTRITELEKRNHELEKRNHELEEQNRRILDKLNSTRSKAPAAYQSPASPTESSQREGAVEGYGAVRDPDGNLRTFTAQSLMAETGI